MDVNKEVAKQNSFKLVGELVEANLETKTSVRSGKDFISGKIVIKSVLEGRQQLTEVELYSNKFKQDGTPNKLFETYANLGTLLNKRVRVSGELGESRFFSTTNSQLVSTTVNRGRYVAPADTGEKDTADFAFAGYIVKPLYEKNSKDGDLLAYEMVVAQANWNNTKPNLIKFTVAKDNKAAVNAIQKLYEKGMTVSVATPGGCERLMNKDGRYLVAIDQAGLTAPASASSAASENDGAAIPNQWQSDCSVTNELEAKAAIATLNQQRLGNPSVLHLSAN